METIAVIGAGGFAREVEWLISDINEEASTAAPRFDFKGFLVSDLQKLGPHDSKPFGDLSWLEQNKIDCLALGIGTPSVRESIGLELRDRYPDIKWPTLVHPTVKMGVSVELGAGVLLCAGVIATVNVKIGDMAMVNLTCTIGHEAEIGPATVINPLVAISGGVHIGKRVLVGTHACILQYVNVGDDAVIGSAAMVNKDVQPGSTVVGVPAKPR